jgi:hypothetical protein
MPVPGYEHIGDLDYYAGDNRLYVPLEGPGGPRVAVLDSSLNVITSYKVQGTNLAWVAVNPADGYLYTAPTFDTVTELRYYDRSNGVYRGTRLLINPDERATSLPNVQGGAFSGTGNKLYLVADARGDHNLGGIWGFDLNRGGRAVRAVQLPVNYEERSAPGGAYTGDELEGITILDLDNRGVPGIGGQIHLLMVDVDGATDDVYFKHYRIDSIKHL